LSVSLKLWTEYGKELACDTVADQLGEGRSTVVVNWTDEAVRNIGQKLHLHNAFIYQSMPMLFNLLKRFTEVQDVLSDDLWKTAQRGESLTVIFRVAGNDLATKFFQRLMAQFMGATYFIALYVLYNL